jgi:hypothetical protein
MFNYELSILETVMLAVNLSLKYVFSIYFSQALRNSRSVQALSSFFTIKVPHLPVLIGH